MGSCVSSKKLGRQRLDSFPQDYVLPKLSTKELWNPSLFGALKATKKRVLFVSAASVSTLYDKIPEQLWEESIVCANTSRDRVLEFYLGGAKAKKKRAEDELRVVQLLPADDSGGDEWLSSCSEQFLTALLVKDSVGMVLWLEPALGASEAWQRVSQQLSQITVANGSAQKLSPLKLDSAFWRMQFQNGEADGGSHIEERSAFDAFENEWICEDYEKYEECSDSQCTETKQEVDDGKEDVKEEDDDCGEESESDNVLLSLPIPDFTTPMLVPSPSAETSRVAKSMFGASAERVLWQLDTCNQLNYALASEIFYQSNPQWLIPLQTIDEELYDKLA